MLQTKAIYNLLRLNAQEDPSLKADPWAIEDLRALALEEIFIRLEKFQVHLDKHSFHRFSEDCDTPEELSDLLLPDDIQQAEHDPFYLIIFELWRRLIPEKQSLSIFCDEIDHRISLYGSQDPKADELIQDALANLLEVLEENTDAGVSPEAVFTAICDYCAHDVESFFYEYISDLLDSGNSLYSSELIEGFSPYITEPLWFDFLRVRLLSFTDIRDANIAVRRLLENDLELPLILEVIHFLSFNADHELLSFAVNKALPKISDREEFNDLMALVADYYRRLDQEDVEQKIQRIIDQQQDAPLSSKDLKVLNEIMAH